MAKFIYSTICLSLSRLCWSCTFRFVASSLALQLSIAEPVVIPARGVVCTLVRMSALSQKYHTYYEKTLKLAGLKKHVLLCLFFFFFVTLCSSSRMYVSGKVKWNNVQSRDNNGAAPRQQAAPTIFIKTMQTSQEELASYRHIDILNAWDQVNPQPQRATPLQPKYKHWNWTNVCTRGSTRVEPLCRGREGGRILSGHESVSANKKPVDVIILI